MAGQDEPTKDEAADKPVRDAPSADADDQPGDDSDSADEDPRGDDSDADEATANESDADESGADGSSPDDSDPDSSADEPSADDSNPDDSNPDDSSAHDSSVADQSDAAVASADPAADSGPPADDDGDADEDEDDELDPFALDDDDFDARFGQYTVGTPSSDDDDRDDGIAGIGGGSEGYAELTRGEPGMDMTRWIVVGVVTVAFILLSFVMIPKLFDSDDTAGPSESEPSTAPSSSAPPAAKPYGETILTTGPAHFWRFSSAAPQNDEIGTSNLTLGKGAFPLGSSAVKDSVGSMDCDGTNKSTIASETPEPGTGDVSVEVWINTQTSKGGQILSFGDEAKGSSDQVVRSMYMDGTGYVYFGINSGKRYAAVSENTYADGKWHQIVGIYSATGGLALYVDGVPVATESKGVDAKPIDQGHWRICGDNLSGWPGGSGSPYFLGSVDEVSVYNSVLSPEQVQAHYAAAQVG